MAFKTLIVSAVAAAGLVAAQSSACSSKNGYTIQSQGDVDALSGCATVSGNVALQTGVTSIDLGSIQEIDGDLVADNTAALVSFSSANLQTVTGNFKMINMTLLTNLNFPQLSSVGSIFWQTLPRLTSLSFSKTITQASSVSITDSQLSSLQGINLNSVDQFFVRSNNQLQAITMPITTVKTSFEVGFNGNPMAISLPNLKVANNMTFSNVSSLDMPALAGVNASIGFYGCTFPSVALANLTQVGGDITFAGNDDLTNVTAPALTTLGGALTMTANSDLDDISGFPKLAQIGGAIDINGNFSNFTLPSLKNVRGACNLQSTENIDPTCTTFNNLHSKGTIQGKVTCKGQQASPSSAPSGTGSSSGSGSSSTSTQKGDAARELYARSAAVTGVMGVFAALLGML